MQSPLTNAPSSSPVAALEKRRRYPRVHIDQPLTLMLKDGTKVRLTAHDISEDGLQMRCDRATAARIHPSGRVIDGEDRAELIAKLALPLGDVHFDLVFVGNLYYFALLEDHQVAFGLRFKTFARDGEAKLRKYMEEAARPAL